MDRSRTDTGDRADDRDRRFLIRELCMLYLLFLIFILLLLYIGIEVHSLDNKLLSISSYVCKLLYLIFCKRIF